MQRREPDTCPQTRFAANGTRIKGAYQRAPFMRWSSMWSPAFDWDAGRVGRHDCSKYVCCLIGTYSADTWDERLNYYQKEQNF